MTFVSGTSELGIARSRLSILSGDRASIPEPRQNYPRAHKCRGGVKKGNPSIDHHLPGIGEIRLGPKRHRFHAYSGESQIDMRQTPCFHVLLLSKDLVLSPLIFTCNSVLGSVDYDRCTYSTHSRKRPSQPSDRHSAIRTKATRPQTWRHCRGAEEAPPSQEDEPRRAQGGLRADEEVVLPGF